MIVPTPDGIHTHLDSAAQHPIRSAAPATPSAPTQAQAPQRTLPELPLQLDLPPRQSERLVIHPHGLYALRHLGERLPRLSEKTLPLFPVPPRLILEPCAFLRPRAQVLDEGGRVPCNAPESGKVPEEESIRALSLR